MKSEADHINEHGKMMVRLGEADSKIRQLSNEKAELEHAVRMARSAIEEAVTFAARWQEMGSLALDVFEATYKRRQVELPKLLQYFIEVRARFDQVLRGSVGVEEAERPKLDEASDSRDNAGEGKKPRSSEQKLKTDSQ